MFPLLSLIFVSWLGFSSAQCFEPPLPVNLKPPYPQALLDGFAQLEANITALVKQYNTASFYASFVVNQDTIWSQGWGVRNKSENPPVTPDADTIYRVGSVAKAFTCLEVLQFRDKGMLRLDDSINTLIPGFAIKNPWKSNRPVTIRQLMGQVAGLVRVTPCESFTTGECPEDTATIVDSLANEWTALPIQTIPSYSNVAYGLLGRGMEIFSPGSSWEQMTQSQIFKPLNMTRSWGTLSPDMDQNFAVAYSGTQAQAYVDLGWENPTGGVFSTANDLGKFLKFLFQYDSLDPSSMILDPQTLREWFAPPILEYDFEIGTSIPWEPHVVGNYTFFLKSGDIGGYSCYIGFLPELKIGFTLTQGDENATLHTMLEQFQEFVVNVMDPVFRTLQPAPVYPSSDLSPYIGVYKGNWGTLYMTLNVTIQFFAGYNRLTLDGNPATPGPSELVYYPQAGPDVFWMSQQFIPHDCKMDFDGTYMDVEFLRSGGQVIGLQIPGLFWGMVAPKS